MYEASADSYAEMMDTEIDLPVYSDTLGRLRARIDNTPRTLIDTACGSGHMLSMYHERYDRNRPLLGIDLSPRMVTIAGRRLGSSAKVVIGDMRDLATVDVSSAAAVLNFFSVHHLDPEGVGVALREWHRVLRSGGQLLLAAWEGVGAIDYGDESDIVALRYRSDELASWTQGAGFTVSRCVIEPVEGMPMEAVYLEGVKE
jgi:ubiquinone/menaquinone biosynthesis C-methylase UbiE